MGGGKKIKINIPDAANINMYMRDFHESYVIRHATGNMRATHDAVVELVLIK